MSQNDKNPDALPESLVAELKNADKASPLITAKVDLTVARIAREQFSSRPAKRRIAAPAWFAVAATVLLAILILPGREDPGSTVEQLYSDVDRSGQIDIADVLALARSENSAATRAELDAFAMQIVSLGDTGESS